VYCGTGTLRNCVSNARSDEKDKIFIFPHRPRFSAGHILINKNSESGADENFKTNVEQDFVAEPEPKDP
jgi:hypothetical protein